MIYDIEFWKLLADWVYFWQLILVQDLQQRMQEKTILWKRGDQFDSDIRKTVTVKLVGVPPLGSYVQDLIQFSVYSN